MSGSLGGLFRFLAAARRRDARLEGDQGGTPRVARAAENEGGHAHKKVADEAGTRSAIASGRRRAALGSAAVE